MKAVFGVFICVLCAIFGVCGAIFANQNKTVYAPTVEAAKVDSTPKGSASLPTGVSIMVSDNNKIKTPKPITITNGKMVFEEYNGLGGYVGNTMKMVITIPTKFATVDHPANFDNVAGLSAGFWFITRPSRTAWEIGKNPNETVISKFDTYETVGANQVATLYHKVGFGPNTVGIADTYTIRIGLRSADPNYATQDIYATTVIEFDMVVSFTPPNLTANFPDSIYGSSNEFKVVADSVNKGGTIGLSYIEGITKMDYGNLPTGTKDISLGSVAKLNETLPDFLVATLRDDGKAYTIKIKDGAKVKNGRYEIGFFLDFYRVDIDANGVINYGNGSAVSGDERAYFHETNWKLTAYLEFVDQEKSGFNYATLLICLAIVGGVGLVWWLSTKMTFYMQVSAQKRQRDREDRAEARRKANERALKGDGGQSGK